MINLFFMVDGDHQSTNLVKDGLIGIYDRFLYIFSKFRKSTSSETRGGKKLKDVFCINFEPRQPLARVWELDMASLGRVHNSSHGTLIEICRHYEQIQVDHFLRDYHQFQHFVIAWVTIRKVVQLHIQQVDLLAGRYQWR